jgi:predicted nucleic acid-binding protein
LGALELLRDLYGVVHVPRRVHEEVASGRSREVPAVERAVREGVIEVHATEAAAAVRLARRHGIHAGEAHAKALAESLGARLFLSNERKVRRAAREEGLVPVGTIGVVLRAAAEGAIDRKRAVRTDRDALRGGLQDTPRHRRGRQGAARWDGGGRARRWRRRKGGPAGMTAASPFCNAPVRVAAVIALAVLLAPPAHAFDVPAYVRIPGGTGYYSSGVHKHTGPGRAGCFNAGSADPSSFASGARGAVARFEINGLLPGDSYTRTYDLVLVPLADEPPSAAEVRAHFSGPVETYGNGGLSTGARGLGPAGSG